MTVCPYCGSNHVDYKGVEGGLGDFGENICDMWECEDCNHAWEGDCIDEAGEENWEHMADEHSGAYDD